MESRNISLTLEKAKEWYNSGSSDLKEVALQAYTKEELTIPEWQNIKTFEDACKTLGLTYWTLNLRLSVLYDTSYSNHLTAIFKLDIISKALNGRDWKPEMTKGAIHYSCVRLYPAGDKAKGVARSNGWEVKESFKANGEKYSLVGGDCYSYGNGLGNFYYGDGGVFSSLGLLGCKSRDIAEHMSRYFAKEIFEACYAHHVGAYEWVD